MITKISTDDDPEAIPDVDIEGVEGDDDDDNSNVEGLLRFIIGIFQLILGQCKTLLAFGNIGFRTAMSFIWRNGEKKSSFTIFQYFGLVSFFNSLMIEKGRFLTPLIQITKENNLPNLQKTIQVRN